jgi:hypothetical protein
MSTGETGTPATPDDAATHPAEDPASSRPANADAPTGAALGLFGWIGAIVALVMWRGSVWSATVWWWQTLTHQGFGHDLRLFNAIMWLCGAFVFALSLITAFIASAAASFGIFAGIELGAWRLVRHNKR